MRRYLPHLAFLIAWAAAFWLMRDLTPDSPAFQKLAFGACMVISCTASLALIARWTHSEGEWL